MLLAFRISSSRPVARLMLTSWKTTGVPSAVGRMSICMTLDPADSACLSAASVFSGASLPPALCDMTNGRPGWALSHGGGRHEVPHPFCSGCSRSPFGMLKASAKQDGRYLIIRYRKNSRAQHLLTRKVQIVDDMPRANIGLRTRSLLTTQRLLQLI